MIFLQSDHQWPLVDGGNPARAMSAWEACGYATRSPLNRLQFAPLGYLFQDGPAPVSLNCTEKLDALAECAARLSGEKPIDPMLVSMTGFLRHDIAAIGEREGAAGAAEDPDGPLPRDAVESLLGNLRRGTLNLDSVYGDDTPNQGDLARSFARAIRSPNDPAQMRVGERPQDAMPSHAAALHGRSDVPRLAAVVGAARSHLTGEDLSVLPASLRSLFVADDGRLDTARAFIADQRNDDHAALTGLHSAFLGFHNTIAQLNAKSLSWSDEITDIYRSSKQLARWHYQWVVMNDYLPAICDPDVVSQTVSRGAPIYRAFLRRFGPLSPQTLPLPLEFLAGAFLFDKLVAMGGKRGAGEAATAAAQTMLRRAHRLNVPCAQQCLVGIEAQTGERLPSLAGGQIAAQNCATALNDGGFFQNTPLCWYICREREVLGQDGRLGPLASRIIAETLAGLIIYDKSSFWAQAGSGPDGRWRPEDGARPGGHLVDSVSALVSAGG